MRDEKGLFVKAIFTFTLVFFFILFGGLKGHAYTTLLFGIALGFLIGREFYSRRK